MTVEQAKARGVCRICGLGERASYDYSMVYNYGKEHAHQDCLDGQSGSPYVTMDIHKELQTENTALRRELAEAKAELDSESRWAKQYMNERDAARREVEEWKEAAEYATDKLIHPDTKALIEHFRREAESLVEPAP